MLFREGKWGPACTRTFSLDLATSLCRYLGWPGAIGSGYKMVANSDTSSCKHVTLLCDEAVCGIRPLYRGIDWKNVLQDSPGAWPWQASIFTNGVFMCGATLIHANFILTDIECAIKCVGHVDPYVTVMLGQDERSEVGLSSQVVLATLKTSK